MAKEVGGRELAAAGSVASAKAVDELLKKKALLVEADDAKAEQHQEGAQAAAAPEAVAAAEGSVFSGQSYEVASAGAVAADGGASGGSWGAAPWLIGGAAVVGGVAIAASSDSKDGDTVIVPGPGTPGGEDPNPDVNDAPVIQFQNGTPNGNVVVAATQGKTAVVGVTVSDVDTTSDKVTVTLIDGNTTDNVTATYNATAGTVTLNGTPAAGTYVFTVKAVDDKGLATTASVSFIIDPVPGNGNNAGGTSGNDTYTLDDNVTGDNASLGAGDDTFNASVGDLNDQDQLDGGEGNDTLNVKLSGGENEFPTIDSVETINVESLGTKTNNLNLDNVNGTTVVNVKDNGSFSADLNINSIVNDSTRINVTGDEVITLKVRNDAPVTNVVDVGVNDFTGDLVLGNKIETLKLAATGVASDFDLIDAGGALKTVIGTGNANLHLVTHASTLYDFSAYTGNLNLVFANPAKAAAEVIGGSGNDTIDFGKTLEKVGDATGPDKVNGGAGIDTFRADIVGNGITVEPIITNTEVLSLSFKSQDANKNIDDGQFDASLVSNTPLYEIRASDAYVNVNDIEAGSNINIVGNINNDNDFNDDGLIQPNLGESGVSGFGKGSTFDFRNGSAATTTVSFITTSQELTALVHTGDLEVNDVKNLSVRVKGQGEVQVFGAIALDRQVTSDLLISTDSEDDDDIDNDGDLSVTGVGFQNNQGQATSNSAISQSEALKNLTIEAVNGNVFLADGSHTQTVVDFPPPGPSTVALADARALFNLDLFVDNAALAIGDIGTVKHAGNLNTVSIEGVNRGLFNLDNIFATTLNPAAIALPGATTAASNQPTAGDGIIEEFFITTAERSEQSPAFSTVAFTEGGTSFRYNQIDDLVASLVEDLRINVAQFGRLQFGDIYSSLEEVDVFGAGRLDLYNDNDNATLVGVTLGTTSTELLGETSGTILPVGGGLGAVRVHNTLLAAYYVDDLDASNHTGPIELDFRTFNGLNLTGAQQFPNIQGYDNAIFVNADVRLGDQNTVDNGIRFDSYGALGLNAGTFTALIELAYADNNLGLFKVPGVNITAGNGNHLITNAAGSIVNNGTDGVDNFEGGIDLRGAALYGLDLDLASRTDDTYADYGIVTGFGNDRVITGSGSSNIFTGFGNDFIDAGAGSDVVRGGFGHDTINVGTGDGARDTVQLLGALLNVNGNTGGGESLGASFDRIIGFEAGAGSDVVQLWNFVAPAPAALVEGAPTNAQLAEFTLQNPDDNLNFLTDFINGLSVPFNTPIVEFTGELLNLDLKDTSLSFADIEGSFVSQFFNDFFAGVINVNPALNGIFFIAYDGDDAALFFVDTAAGGNVINEANIELVSVFEGIQTGQFTVGDFQIATSVN